MLRYSLIVLVIVTFFSISCKKKKVEDKVDGLWNVTYISNREAAILFAGTIEFKENGKGAFNLNYYNPLTKQQVVDTRTIEWKNTKNTFQIYFINGDGNLYFKIDHLSKTQFIIYSGDYFYSEIKMNR
jgi:hypothetical protein